MTVKLSFFGGAVYVTAFSVILWLSIDLVSLRKDHAAFADSLAVIQRRGQVCESDLIQYRSVILRHPLGTPLVTGLRAEDGKSTVSLSGDGIYYVIKTSCPACAINVPLLNRLHAEGTSVVGMTYDTPQDMQAFVAQYDVRFPVVADARGILPSLIPGNIRPVTFRVYEGRITELVIGELRRGLMR